MDKIVKEFTFNRLVFVLGLLLWGGLNFAGKDIPGWLQFIVTSGGGAAMVYQGFSNSVAKKDDGDKPE